MAFGIFNYYHYYFLSCLQFNLAFKHKEGTMEEWMNVFLSIGFCVISTHAADSEGKTVHNKMQ